jgi:hypothetical protein
MDRLMELFAAERPQFLVYIALSVAVTAGTAVLFYYNREIYQPFFGRLNPVLVMALISLLGFILLAFLLGRGWFAIFESQNLTGWLVAGGLAVLFALAMIFFDSRVVLPADVNRPFPDSLLFYPTIGFVVEIVFHVLPLTLLLLLASALFKSLPFESLVWPCIFLVALLEPIFQTWFGFSRPYPAWVFAFVAVHNFLLNFTQLALFKRYDFVTMYSFRLVYYLFWHIVWDFFRLKLLF